MLPLFPRAAGVCTTVPIKISVRRAAVQRPTVLEVWNKQTNKRVGSAITIAADSGAIDIREAMAAIIAEQANTTVAISTSREIRVLITSPSLPPMNFVDLPGMVAHPPERKELTRQLVSEYMADHADSSTYLAVIKADTAPHSSEAIGQVFAHGVANRTIGVFTFCDKLDEGEERDMMLRWLHNDPSTADGVPLEPYGYVVTMNKELKKASADETNHARLLRQAHREKAWFKEEGFEEEVRDGLASTAALVAKIQTMYKEYALGTFLYSTVGRLLSESRTLEAGLMELGLPPSPGNL